MSVQERLNKSTVQFLKIAHHVVFARKRYENGRQMVVTPKEIDLLINRASELIALAINYALHSDLNLSDLMSLMY